MRRFSSRPPHAFHYLARSFPQGKNCISTRKSFTVTQIRRPEQVWNTVGTARSLSRRFPEDGKRAMVITIQEQGKGYPSEKETRANTCVSWETPKRYGSFNRTGAQNIRYQASSTNDLLHVRGEATQPGDLTRFQDTAQTTRIGTHDRSRTPTPLPASRFLLATSTARHGTAIDPNPRPPSPVGVVVGPRILLRNPLLLW